MLTALPGAEYRDEINHHHLAVRTSAIVRVTMLASELTISVDPASYGILSVSQAEQDAEETRRAR